MGCMDFPIAPSPLSQLLRNRSELLQSGLKVVGDLLREDVGGGQLVGVLKALVA